MTRTTDPTRIRLERLKSLSVMGYDNPRALRGTVPFNFCDNHLLLAEQSGLGTADLKQIDVRGLTIAQARYPYSTAGRP